MEAFSIL